MNPSRVAADVNEAIGMELAVGGAVFLALIVVLTVVLSRRRSTGKQGEAELNTTAAAIAEANRLRTTAATASSRGPTRPTAGKVSACR